MQSALVGFKHHIGVAVGLLMDDESIPVLSDIVFTLDQRKGEYTCSPRSKSISLNIE
jgi:hypothetical protein